MCTTQVILLPVRWLVVRGNPVENRNVFCLGMGGRSAKATRPAPWNQSSMCTLGNSLILSLTHGKKSLGISSKDRMELICKIILAHDEN